MLKIKDNDLNDIRKYLDLRKQYTELEKSLEKRLVDIIDMKYGDYINGFENHKVEVDKDGKEIDKWVSTNEPHYIEGLEEGEYILTEIIAPNGYVLSKETIKFTLEANGSVKEVVMYNTKTTIVKISKQDVTTKKELPGATLVVKNKNDKIDVSYELYDEKKYSSGDVAGFVNVKLNEKLVRKEKIYVEVKKQKENLSFWDKLKRWLGW